MDWFSILFGFLWGVTMVGGCWLISIDQVRERRRNAYLLDTFPPPE